MRTGKLVRRCCSQNRYLSTTKMNVVGKTNGVVTSNNKSSISHFSHSRHDVRSYHTSPQLRSSGISHHSVDLEKVQEVLSREHEDTHPLNYFFKPKSIVVMGASEKQGEAGRVILWNLMTCTAIKVYPINYNNKKTVLGLTAYSCISDIYNRANVSSIDLAIICTPRNQILQALENCIQHGIRAAAIVNPDSSQANSILTKEEKELFAKIKLLAKQSGIRILGPDCLGVMTPAQKPNGESTFINATYTSTHALNGRVAVISQTSEMSTTILDWSLKKNVGFSAFLSVGRMLNVGWGDLIDYFGRDEQTDAIILYMEDIGDMVDARNFVSAARTVALKKPIIVMKVGKSCEISSTSEENESLASSLIHSDEVINSMFERCGVLRVETIEDLFNMSQLLAKQPRPKGNRIALVSNSESAAKVASDSLARGKGKIATLSASTQKALRSIVPNGLVTSPAPICILPNAKPERYTEVMDLLSKDPNVDAILAILTPQEHSEPTRTAKLLAQKYSPSILKAGPNKHHPVILTCFMGGVEVEFGRDLLVANGIPSFIFPDTVIQVFNYMWKYSKNLENLYETSTLLDRHQPLLQKVSDSSVLTAHEFLWNIMQSGRTILTEYESKHILELYGIPVTKSIIAKSVDEAIAAARKIGYPVVLKIHSETLTKKFEVNAVKLNLYDDESVARCFNKIKSETEKLGNNHFQGVTVQKMIKQVGGNSSFELFLGSNYGEQFGPVIMFGTGGSYIQIHEDIAIGIPPLTNQLARKVINNVKISKALHGYRGKPSLNVDLIEQVLVRFSRLVMDLSPLVHSIDINPIKVSDAPFVDSDEYLIALDAKIILHSKPLEYSPLIRRYPSEYLTQITLRNNESAIVRPLRFEDHPTIVNFFASLSHEQLSMSEKEEALNYEVAFYNLKKRQEAHNASGERIEPLELDQSSISKQIYNELLQFCIGEYDREMSLGVIVENQIIAVGRYTLSPGKQDVRQAEIAILVKDQYQSVGVGTILLKKLIQIAEKEGVKRLIANVHRDNTGMLKLTRKLNFEMRENNNRPEFVKMVLRFE